MIDLGAVLAQLKKEREKLDRAIAALSGIAGGVGSGLGRRKLSAAARERIAAAQRARWADQGEEEIKQYAIGIEGMPIGAPFLSLQHLASQAFQMFPISPAWWRPLEP